MIIIHNYQKSSMIITLVAVILLIMYIQQLFINNYRYNYYYNYSCFNFDEISDYDYYQYYYNSINLDLNRYLYCL